MYCKTASECESVHSSLMCLGWQVSLVRLLEFKLGLKVLNPLSPLIGQEAITRSQHGNARHQNAMMPDIFSSVSLRRRTEGA